jgi:anti-anti-sigma regulatory factor
MALRSTDSDDSRQSSLSTIREHLVVSLPDNFDDHDLTALEEQVLDRLSLNKRIRGVIIDFASVQSTDADDLNRLQNCLLAVRLLGRKVALCGINPGVAAVIIRSGQDLHRDLVGQDINDVLQKV